MKPKDRVCSLELSKELRELGVKQESLWWWSFGPMDDISLQIGPKTGNLLEPIYNYPAFTLTELEIYFKNIDRETLERKLASSDRFWIEWELQRNKIIMDLNFLAEVLIYLIKNKIIEV